MYILGGTFLPLCHNKGSWTVTAQVVFQFENHYDSAHDPSLVTNIYTKYRYVSK